MSLFFNASAGLSASQNTTNSQEEDDIQTEKQGQSSSATSGVTIGQTNTQNSGSTNTSNTATTGGTAASTNTTVVGPSSQTTNNSGSVNTSQLMLSQDAVNHLVEQMLSGTSGLAAVSGGQKQAGGYDSTAQALLTNDLLSQVAGEVAARGAQTVQTIGGSTQTVNNSGSLTTQNIGATSNFSNANTIQNIGASSSSSTSVNTSDSMTNTQSLEDMVGVSTNTASKHDDKMQEDTKASGGWIVCTELVLQNRMPKRFYIYGLKAFTSYDARGKRGYYIWAIPAVKHLRAHPYSYTSRMLASVMNARAEYLAAESDCKGAKKTVKGYLAKHLLYGICWTLSRTIARNFTHNTVEEVAYVWR